MKRKLVKLAALVAAISGISLLAQAPAPIATAGSGALMNAICPTSGALVGNNNSAFGVAGGICFTGSTSNPAIMFARSGVFSSFAVVMSGAPGGSAAATWTLTDNGTPTAVTCTITDPATSCTWNGSVAGTVGHTYYYVLTLSGTPTGNVWIKFSLNYQ